MKLKNTTFRPLLATLTLSASLIGGAQASVLITFSEVGGNVVASTSGGLDLSLLNQDTFGAAQGALNLASSMYLVSVSGTGTIDRYDGGTSQFTFPINSNPSSHTGVDFGFIQGWVIVPATTSGYFEPNKTWTWNNTTLSQLGMGTLTDTPTLAHTVGSGETISYVTTVPEPSSFALLGISGLTLLCRRNRSH